MDVYRLDKGSYLPDELIEGYSSMIWTERYTPAGDFQMKTAQIAAMRAILPEGSLISLRDSREVMQVETHSIDKDPDGAPELTIVGRTFETFYENRGLATVLRAGFDPKYFIRALTTAEQVEYLLWNDVVDNPSHTSNPNWVPNLVIADAVSNIEDQIYNELPYVGDAYTQILSLLTKGGHGIRTLRPISMFAALVSFDATGTPSYTPATTVSDLMIEVYNGLDRTRNQIDRVPVVLSYDSGDLTDPQYLFTLKDYKNVADVRVDPANPDPSNQIYYIDGASAATTGLDRRVLAVDASDIAYSADPSYLSAVQARALSELSKHNSRTLFGSEISPLAHYQYGVEYFLGDLVTLAAEYNFEQTMRVTEYVRTEDQAGDRGYPTLSLA